MRLALVSLTTAIVFGSTPAPPALRLVDTSPLTIRGVRFEPGERIRVSVSGDVSGSRGVRATTNGAFVLRFGLVADRCTQLLIRASGFRGSRAKLELLPACAPAP